MDSHERHELANNELADALGSGIQRVKPYTAYILLGLVLVIVVMWLVFRQQEEAAAAAVRRVGEFSAALTAGGPMTATQVDTIRDQRIAALRGFLGKPEHEGSKTAPLAKHTLAGMYYNRGLGMLMRGDVEDAKDNLGYARDLYTELVREPKPLGQLAAYSLACLTALEDPQKAEQALSDLAESQADSAVAVLASERLAAMDQAAKVTMVEKAPEPVEPSSGGATGEGEGDMGLPQLEPMNDQAAPAPSVYEDDDSMIEPDDDGGDGMEMETE